MTLELSTPDELTYQFHPVSTGSLHFKVRAPNDAHIALTSGPEESDPMYEIFIGGWSNSKSVIRKNRTKPDVAEAATPDILAAGEFRGFWISWSNGKLSAGKEGDTEPFLTYTDSESFGIGYYGVCTGWGATGTWLIEGGIEVLFTSDGGDCLSYTFRPLQFGSLDLHIRSPHDAHIALTSSPRDTNPIVEIILGGWKNTASALRYLKEQPDKVRVETPVLLSSGEFRHFVITWQREAIRVKHRDNVLFEWQIPKPFGISYFGVRTGWGASGFWRCKVVDPRTHTRATTQAGWNVTGISSGGIGTWVDAANGEVPAGAVPGGMDGEQIYVARASLNDAVIPGKLVPSHGVTYVAWGGAEHGQSEYQVLCGLEPKWVAARDGEVPPGAVPGGQAEDGEQLFIARVDHEGVSVIGKLQASHKVCYIPFGGQELSYPDYEVLVN